MYLFTVVNVVVYSTSLCRDSLQEVGVMIRAKTKCVDCAIKLLQVRRPESYA